jgi:hypothetical protein
LRVTAQRRLSAFRKSIVPGAGAKVDGTKKAQSFKWSRDNASIETTFEVLSDKIIRVSDLGKDDVLGFAGNQWVEIVDDVSALGGNPNPLAQIDSIDPDAREITLKTSVLSFQNKKNLKLRRWDMVQLLHRTVLQLLQAGRILKMAYR